MRQSFAEQLGIQLARQQRRIVLAESCTGGMAAALLTQVPGISNWFCGSAVTYRQTTKLQWFGIANETIGQFTAESLPTTEEMAVRVLEKTPEAHLSGAITGHLGPGVDPSLDGVVFISIARRIRRLPNLEVEETPIQTIHSQSHRLQASSRTDRQMEAAELLLAKLEAHLRTEDYSSKPE